MKRAVTARSATKGHLFLRVDPIACEGCGLCAELLPEMVTLDDWGYPIISPQEVPKELVDEVKEVVRTCPKLALWLEI